jgi:hypothetical protein
MKMYGTLDAQTFQPPSPRVQVLGVEFAGDETDRELRNGTSAMAMWVDPVMRVGTETWTAMRYSNYVPSAHHVQFHSAFCWRLHTGKRPSFSRLRHSTAAAGSHTDTKAIPVGGRGGPQGCEMLRIPHCLDNPLTDGGEVLILTHRLRSTPQKHFLPLVFIYVRAFVNSRA